MIAAARSRSVRQLAWPITARVLARVLLLLPNTGRCSKKIESTSKSGIAPPVAQRSAEIVKTNPMAAHPKDNSDGTINAKHSDT